jgi:hypothetical protein
VRQRIEGLLSLMLVGQAVEVQLFSTTVAVAGLAGLAGAVVARAEPEWGR